MTIMLPLVLIIMVAVVGYFLYKASVVGNEEPHTVICTQEAKQCPDGSYVMRVGSNCEFTQCPVTSAQNCITNGDCKEGFSCVTVGPLQAGRPPQKTCVQNGQAGPL